MCITDLDLGGAERCLAQLAARAGRGRFEPVVLCLGPRPQRAERSCVPILEAAGVETHFLNARRYWQFPRVVRTLAGLLRQPGADLLQTFLFHANLAGRLAAREAGVPAVVSGIRVAERASRWHLWLDRWTHPYVDRYACVSKAAADFTASRGRIPAEKLVVIPNGIDAAQYPAAHPANPADLGVSPGRRIVVFVGRLHEQKGAEWLIETAPGWLGRLPDCDLVLVGEGPLRPALELLALRLGIAGRVHFTGFRTDVPAILRASGLLVLPSRWEGMPNALLEAMASGLPVVATRAEGVVELLGPAAGEQTVAFGESQGFAERVVALMSDPDRAMRLGAANRARAEESFSVSAMVGAYEKLWDSLLEAQGR